jgi:PAS domain S-box-containing protein
VSKFPIRGPAGEVSLVGGMAFEITDRIRTEEALRASEERFAQFMRHLPGLAWIKDLAGRHVFANAAFEREFGLAAGGAAGRTNAELFAPGVAARYNETDRLALGGGYTAVESDPGLSGPMRHWLVTKFPIPGPDGRPALAGGIAIDVTEQKRAEEALREHAELLDLATDAILVHDPAGALTYWNRGAERLYGWSREEALGRRPDALLRTVFPRPREEITAEVARAGHWEGDLAHTRRDGSAVVVASRWTRRLGEGGSLAAILEINTDVTERTQAAELRSQFLARLIAAQEDERGRVARELHDGVAQTLSALHLRVGALTRRPLPAEILGELDELRRAAQAAVEEVRFLARGLRPPVLDELGLLPALTRYAEDFARTHGIRAEVVASGPAGGRLPAEVETALYRIAQEALANVARHSRASTVSVVLLRGPTFVQLLVEDDGAGWDPTSPPADGDAYHHLGLQGMRERAALLGGSLSVESSPGDGTAVCARLPLRGEV